MANVYFPGDAPIRVHQYRVAHCLREFPAGYFWYGGKRKGRGKPPKWVEKLLQEPSSEEGLEPQEEDIESDSESTREIDVSQVEPGDGDTLVEPEPVGVLKQGTLEDTSILETRKLTIHLGQSSSPEDTHEGRSGRAFIRRAVM